MGGKKDRVAQKSEAAASKKAAADEERQKQEEAEWDKGAKKPSKKKQDDEEKRAKKLEEKTKREQALKEEMDALPSKPKGSGSGKASGKSSAAPARKTPPIDDAFGVDEPLATLNASNIEDALDALDIASKSSKTMTHAVDTHPERRRQAAYEAYKERELPIIKKERPGLRLQQYQELLWKAFLKSPDNPMNQVTASYNATVEEKREVIDQKRKATEKRLL